MKNHVFLIQAHACPELVCMLVERLKAPNHYFVIHIDKKSKLFNTFTTIVKGENVYFMGKRRSVKWGAPSQFYVTLDLIEYAINLDCIFDYYHLISGQDMPVYSNAKFDDFFESTNCLFMGVVPKFHESYRYMLFHLDEFIDRRSIMGYILSGTTTRIQKVLSKYIKLRPDLFLKIYGGGNWWSLTHEAIDYIRTYINNNPQYLKRFRFTTCCDEIFFHTILFNSSLKKDIVIDDKRYIDWKAKEEGESLPRVLDENDYQEILSSGALFVRKISLNKSDKLIKMLAQND